MLSLDQFPNFFAAVNDGSAPFPWQTRLVRHLVDHGQWPENVTAPTGAGKSAVVEAHVFANALASVGQGHRVPRRLAVSVNRRGMVDHHHERARTIANLLMTPADGVMTDVAQALTNLASVTCEGSSPLRVVSLRGGVRPDGEWLQDPSACAVLAVTPDMWGSRLLFTGYGSTRAARPREAGLLGVDSAIVLDEAHLNRQLEVTARQISRMTAPDGRTLGLPGLQVCSMTATPTTQTGSSVRVTEEDLGISPELSRRLRAVKPVTVVPGTPGTSTKAPGSYVRTVASAAVELAGEVRSGDERLAQTVGVVVNHVDTAARVAASLARQGHRVRTWVGRMRPMDLERARQENPGLFCIDGDPDVDFLVATQTIEVGVDLDLAGMVTELAPASALAQRFGRVNRRGLRTSAPLRVVAPQEVVKDRPPYRSEDLRTALDWVEEITELDGGASPWALTQTPPPQQSLERLVLTRTSPAEVELLAHTSVEPFAEPDLTFQLRDSLDADRAMAGIVMRSPLPEDDASATDLLGKTPPDTREIFPVTVRLARTVAQAVLEGQTSAPSRVWRWRGEELSQLNEEDRVLPGDALVMDRQPFVLAGVVVDRAEDDPDTAAAINTVWGPAGVEVLFAESDERVRELWASQADDEEPDGPELFWPAGVGSSGPDWLVLKSPERVEEDPEARQEWSTSPAVALTVHSDAVAARAASMAQRIGLSETVTELLRSAGVWHDAGKKDERFQVEVLGRAPDQEPLAKSHGRGAQARALHRSASSLPHGWRHEQLSAAHVLAHYSGPEADTVARLVGTSHGRGRPLFPHGADGLLDTDTPAAVQAATRELFTAGAGWSDVWESTHARYGVYGCAYLEAVLRSADCTVSKEGS